MNQPNPKTERFDEIVMLVHPLFATINDIYRLKYKHSDNPKALEEYYQRYYQRILKKSLAEYGKKVLEYAKTPDKLIVLVKPNLYAFIELTLDQRNYLSGLYKELINKFESFFLTHPDFEGRFVTTNFDPRIRESLFYQKTYLIK